MKNAVDNLTWKHVALFFGLLTASIVAHGFAPAAAQSVDTLGATILGFVARSLLTSSDDQGKAP